jgi:drug/metabolite transporter (DMT)-like permease
MGHAHSDEHAASALPLGAVVQCFAAAVLFGASTPASKLAVAAVPLLLLAGLLYFGAALAVAPAALSQRRPPLPRGALARGLVAVIVGGGVAPVLMLLALARAQAADVSIWLSLETVFTGMLGHLFFHEQLGRKAWAANACIFLAGCLVAAPTGWSFGPALLVTGACLGWALDNNLSAALAEVSPAQLTLAKGLFAGTFNVGLGLALGERLPSFRLIAGGLAIGTLGYGLSLVLYLRGARQLGAARSQMIFASAPLAGVLLSWGALGEPLHLPQLAAVAVLVVGLLLLFSERHAHAHIHEPVVHSHEHRHDDGHHAHPHDGLSAGASHTHEHAHGELAHAHPHLPDPHHRHTH